MDVILATANIEQFKNLMKKLYDEANFIGYLLSKNTKKMPDGDVITSIEYTQVERWTKLDKLLES